MKKNILLFFMTIIFAVSTFVSRPAQAFDLVFVVPEVLFLGQGGGRFGKTEELIVDLEDERSAWLVLLKVIFVLPFAILSDDGRTGVITDKQLLELGLSDTQIDQVKLDFDRINEQTTTRSFKSLEEFKQMLIGLNLSPESLQLLKVK